MIKDKERLSIMMASYISASDTRWDLANKVLYDLCQGHPSHTDPDEIVAKIWLIGRSYAAAIERRKNADASDGDFYYDKVAPALIAIGNELDSRLGQLNTHPLVDGTTLDLVLETHGLLVQAFNTLTEMNKRSLASKYLHFHCPNMFFIYDNRANISIRKLVSKGKDRLYKYIAFGRDMEYTDFCIRMLELQEYIYHEYGRKMSPRELDNLLLYHNAQ